KLMPFGIRELHDLVLDRRTIARSTRGDGAAVHRGAADVVGDDLLRGRTRERDPARQLLRLPRWRRPEMRPAIRKLVELRGLRDQLREVDRAAVDPRRRAGLEP